MYRRFSLAYSATFPERLKLKLAAIDIGSNALRLLIVRILPEHKTGDFKKVEFVRIPLRLGDDVFTSGKVGVEKKNLFLMAMQAFKLIMDIHGVEHYMACATSAMREASNGKAIVEACKKKFDLKIQIISGEEESRLILQSVMESIKRKGNFINIDVGGGSTEITLIHDGKPRESKSFPIGTVRLMDGKVKQESWNEMEKWVRKQAGALKKIKALGTGGNISKLYRMRSVQEEGAYLPIDELEHLYERICSMPIKERIYQMRMNPDRADVIEHAAKIYLQIMHWANVEEIIAPKAGLKEGLILELFSKLKSN
ncbi:MAG: exopolyphosphatase [Bacteroidota bacterium]|nr:exopolyphosphatase [Bacteroidota bacterium]